MDSIAPATADGNSAPTAGVLSSQKVSPRKAALLKAQEALERVVDEGWTPTLEHPPSIWWWRSRYCSYLPSAVLMYSFQYKFQRLRAVKNSKDTTRYAALTAADWQAASGVTPDEWPKAIKGVSRLITKEIHGFAKIKNTFLRPTEEFMDIFGLDLPTYDLVGYIERTRLAGKPAKGGVAPKYRAITSTEKESLLRWKIAGGYTVYGGSSVHDNPKP